METMELQLFIGFANLAIGLLIGWYACRSRRAAKQAANRPQKEEAVTSLLDEIRETMSDQVYTWDSLQQLLAEKPNPSAQDLGMHLRANRLYERLLKSYGDQLAHYDPEKNLIPEELAKTVVASRSEIAPLMEALEQFDSHRDEGALKTLAERLSELEQSNRTLREELNAAQSKISEQSVRLKDAVNQALHDHLTELPNRRAFDQKLIELDDVFRLHGRIYSLLIIDLDHFKKFNDTYGHDAGDAVLKMAAKVMRDCCGEEAIPFRYGGEEFAILAVGCGLADASELAERIRLRLEQATLTFEEQTLQVTCSIGVAQAIAERNREALIRTADEALYVAKEAGRNVTHIAPLEEVPVAAG